MLTEMKLINTQPQRIVTLWPSTRVMYIVVERPYGTAIIANDKPRTDSIDRFRGSSDLYPMRARSASAAVAECDLTTPDEAEDARRMSMVGDRSGGDSAGGLVVWYIESRGLWSGHDLVA
jgi:hypothetical protein